MLLASREHAQVSGGMRATYGGARHDARERIGVEAYEKRPLPTMRKIGNCPI